MTTQRKPLDWIKAAQAMGLILPLAVLTLAACVQGAPVGSSPNNAVTPAGKVAPILEAAAQQLAAGTPASDFTRGPVRADSSGRLQVYVYINRFSSDNLAALTAHGLADALPSPELHLVQGWVNPQDLESLAGLPFVTRITPPHYAQPR